MITSTANSDRITRQGSAMNASPMHAGGLSAGADSSAGTFGKLLSARQQLLTGSLHNDDKTSANLMFEPSPSDKDSASHVAENQTSEAQQDPPPRSPSKTKQIESKSNTTRTHDSDTNWSATYGRNARLETPAVADHAPGNEAHQSGASLLNGASADAVASGVHETNAEEASLHTSADTNEIPNQNTDFRNSAAVKNGTGRADDSSATSVVSGSNAVRPSGDAETEGNPARQIGRLLAAPGSNDATGSARERQEVQAAPNQNAKAPPQPQQPARAGADRDVAQNSASKAKSSDPAQPTPFEQLVQTLRLRVGSKVSSAVMRLHPPQLGKMKIDVRAIGDQIRVAVETETQAARDRVHERAFELRAALAQHGIDVRQFDVTVGPPVHAETYFAQGWGRSSDAERRDSGKSMNFGSRGEGANHVAADSIDSGFTAVGTTRLDVRV